MQGIYRRDEANLLAFNSALAGAGLKPKHATEVLGGAHAVDFFEVHAANYMGDGGPPHRLLIEVRAGRVMARA